MKLAPIIQPEELVNLNPKDYLLFDASAGSETRYNEKHLDTALYIDLNTDLACVNDFANGGRHPLPSLEQFSTTVANYGITKERHVVIYDDKMGSNAAARFWWMLKAAGYQKVQVINGGFNAAIEAGFPVNNKTTTASPVTANPIKAWQLPLTLINEVEIDTLNSQKTIIDVRDANRYYGLTEPIDLIAGHIPNAVNIPFTQNLDSKGFFLQPNQLKAMYTAILGSKASTHITVHCGSGVTACHTLLAMDYAGLEIPRLYVGSWSEWSRNNKEMILAED